MNYFVKRGEDRFGPYSLADLQHYVQTGSVALEDLAQSEGMTDWVPVSQVIGDIPVPATVEGPGTVAAPVAEPSVPLPPNLNWSIVLLLTFVTCGLFSIVWGFILATWAKKLDRDNRSVVFMLIYAVLSILAVGIEVSGEQPGLSLFARLGGAVCYLVSVFGIRSSMERYYTSTEDIGLSLNGTMTFFFNIFYFQYHVNRLHRWKQTGVLS